MKNLKLLLLVFIPALGFCTTTASVVKTTAQQAVLETVTDYSGACSILVSTSPTYSPVVNDVNATLFPGSNLDSRPEAINGGKHRSFIIGVRAAELYAGDHRNKSRSLQAETPHYWKETCGSDVVASTFTTTPIRFGTTYGDPRDDRTSPGDLAYPTWDYSTTAGTVIDPFTGAQLTRIGGEFDAQAQVTIEQLLNPRLPIASTQWTTTSGSATYNGTSQSYIFFPSSYTSVLNGNDQRELMWLQLNAKIYGNVGSVDVCLSADGQTCSGGSITQTITTTATNYVIGTSTPVLESWRNTPVSQFRTKDLTQIGGTVLIAADGRNISTFNSTFFNSKLSSGSVINIGSSQLVVSSITNQNNLTLTTATNDVGLSTFTVQNGGFLVRAHTAANGSFTIVASTYSMEVAAYIGGSVSGTATYCDPNPVIGPTGQGSFCSFPILGYYGQDGNAMYFIGNDGTVNFIGVDGLTPSGGPFVNDGCASGSTIWDPVVPGKYYCLMQIGNGVLAVVQNVYGGSYTAYPSTSTSAELPNSSSTVLSSNINLLVAAYDARFSTTNYVYGWSVQGITPSPYGSQGALFLTQARQIQNGDGGVAVFDIANSSVVATLSTIGGAPGSGAANRWAGLHASGPTNTTWAVVGLAENHVPSYTLTLTSNTLNSNYQTCPANTVDPAVVGLSSCSLNVAISTNVPTNSGTSLFNDIISTGDAVVIQVNGVDMEKARVLTMSGLNLTLERCYQNPYFVNCGDHTSGSVNLRMSNSYNTISTNWNWADDPHAQTLTKSYGSTLAPDPYVYDCHTVFGDAFTVAGCGTIPDYSQPSYAVRYGAIPNFNNPIIWPNENRGFASDSKALDNTSNASHPSAVAGAPYYINTHPFMGDSSICYAPGVCPLVSGTTYIWKAQASLFANAGEDYRSRPYFVDSGEHQLADFTGTMLTDTKADNYKFCYAILAGDCYAGSSAGDVYMNIPNVTYPYGFSAFLNTSFGNDISIAPWVKNTSDSNELYANVSDREGLHDRIISTDQLVPKMQTNYANGRITPTGRFHVANALYMDKARSGFVMSKLTSEVWDSRTRSDFMQVPINMSGKTGDTVRIRFGYRENGAPSQFYCSPARVSCATDGSGTKPYLWTNETQQWTTCGTSGCAPSIPLLPGHIAYYVVDRKNSAGIVTTSEMRFATAE